MLNLSENSIDHRVDKTKYKSFKLLKTVRASLIFTRLLLVMLVALMILLALPWTQNIRSKGFVTTLQPGKRPQTIPSVIPGRIEKWFVQEGDLVNKGDTILFLSEIKDEYFDPNLLGNTRDQISAKESSVRAYMEKVKSLDAQIDALLETQELKEKQAQNYIQQAKLKIQSDSIDLEAAKTNLKIAEEQLVRMEELYKQGLKSLTDLEARRLKVQESLAKKISAENKVLSAKNELINAQVELSSIRNQYQEKLSKAESEKYAAMSALYETEGDVTKLQNQYMNYSVRSGYYYVKAPQKGYITKAVRSGLGETIKEGEALVTVMPTDYDLAVEMYVKPMDLPLLEKGQEVRFMFDGWPSVVFSGWPNLSYGTFGGKVVAIDNFTSDNGKYRILVAPDPEEEEWPEGLRVGSGANGLALLKEVPVWYEIWRQLNGFPPDYYKPQKTEEKETK